MASVKLIDIEKRWGGVVGVARQSLEIADGEFVVFLGPSGCGKTTTMRMVAGLEAPSAGEIWIGGQDVTDALPKDRDVATAATTALLRMKGFAIFRVHNVAINRDALAMADAMLAFQTKP